MKHESIYDDEYMNEDIHARHSLPNHFSVGSSHLQDIAFSAQQALARGGDDVVPVDPALQAYANGAFSAMEMTPSYATNGDGIVSSIEQQSEDDMMDGSGFAQHNSQPSVEPLTPGPPPHNDTMHARGNGYPASLTVHVQPNGYPASDTIHVQPNGFAAPDTIHVQPNSYPSKSAHEHNAVRQPSSPMSPRHMPPVSSGTSNYDPYMVSPTTMNHNNTHYNFTANSDFPPPPITPTANARGPTSSGRKSSQTPSRARASKTPKSTPGSNRRRDSKDGIKLESGLGMGINGIMDMMIDPSLDQASIDLIKQLQQEELGLRRRAS